jgi:ribosomal protein S1
MSILNELDRPFPDHRSASRAAEWEALRARLAYGQSVSGTVVFKSPFGAWVDLGVGFPALLEITGIAELTPEKYRAGDWCPVGSEVSALVGGFSSRSHQIGLCQCRSNRASNK